MERQFNWSWVEQQVSGAIARWHGCAHQSIPDGPRYSCREQDRRERAYDEALAVVEQEARRVRARRSERADARRRIVAEFPKFATVALGLEDEAVQMLTEGFLPVGTAFAQWARRFDPHLSMPDIIQACRNAWTVCGLQPLLGDRMQMTPAIVGYSLLYPYSDNFLDSDRISKTQKLEFSQRFRDRLCGLRLAARDHHEAAVWAMVALIESQYPRRQFPRVYECLLAIHQAQENSIAQLKRNHALSADDLLRLSCAKGGTSVLADACLAHGFLSEAEARFAFDWGVLLQLGDDLQDIEEDLQHGSATLFSRGVAAGIHLDDLVRQLLVFSESVADELDALPHGEAALKRLMRSSWRSLIVMAIARSHRFFSSHFLAEFEPVSPFRFGFQRSRHTRLAGRRGLYKVLFESFLKSECTDLSCLPHPEGWWTRSRDIAVADESPIMAGSCV
jgi:hypothetical protein